jgi:ABC-type nitrate/sulfonate/bicarbonate transport system permease component
MLGLAGVVVALLAWHLVAMTSSGAAIISPLQTWTALMDAFATPAFWKSVGMTLVVAGQGFGLAIAVGVPTGILIGWSRLLGHATRVPLEFLKPIPPIVIMPSVILILGPTQDMAVFLIFYGCVMPIIYQTATGVKEVDPVAVETGRSYGMGRAEILYRIVFPSASAFIGTALRIAMPTALIVAVVAGLLGGGPGLGRDIFLAMSAGQYDYLYALVVVLGFLGLAVQFVEHRIEGRMLHWHTSYRTGV